MQEITTIDDLKCRARGRPVHFVNKPKILSCGHLICTMCIKCVPQNIVCNKCGARNLNDLSESFDKDNGLFESHLKGASEFTYLMLNEIQEQFKAELVDLNSKVDAHFGFLEEGINLRVESLKAKLDAAGDSLKIELKEAKNKLKTHVSNLFDQSESNDKLNDELKTFKDNIEKNTIQNEIFQKLNRKMLNLQESINEMKRYSFQANFDENKNFKIHDLPIGTISCEFDFLTNKLMSKEEEPIHFDLDAVKMLQLTNGNILARSFNALTLYDTEFDLIRKISEIDDKKINPIDFTSDASDNIYVTSCNDKYIHKLDSTLNYIHSTKNEFDTSFRSIFVDSRYVYGIRSQSSNLIDVFHQHSLVKFSTIQKEEAISQIKVLNDIACVSNDTGKIQFYKLPYFKKINEYEDNGFIFIHDNSFFTIDSKQNIHVYNSDGLGKKESLRRKHTGLGVGGPAGNVSLINNSLYVRSFYKLSRI